MSKILAKFTDSAALDVAVIFAVSVLVTMPILVFGILFEVTMFIELPAEKSEVTLSFIEPAASLISRKISLAAWLSVLPLYLYHLFYLKKDAIR
jgi:hypothetical protein